MPHEPKDEFDVELDDHGQPPDVGKHPNAKGRGKPTKAEQEGHHDEAVPDEAGNHGKEPNP